MSIESIITSLPSQVENFLEIRNYYVDELYFHEEILKPQKSVSDYNSLVRQKIVDFFFTAKNYYTKQKWHLNMALCNNMTEAIKNANFYGGTKDNHSITFQSILSPKGMLTSYNDCGLYFKKEQTKYDWENRVNSDEESGVDVRSEDGRKFSGFGIGKEVMFALNDLIFVDNNSGTLYLGTSTKHQYFGQRLK